ncbi:MAG: glycosyltransferase family 39 protein [Syntrophales bacterium]|nr:glycosyltransferase family 39 protein [Syntrophales bacterium]
MDNSTFRPLRIAYVLMLSTLVTGFGSLAVLPPMEGADEIAHYSYIQQIADAGTMSVFSEKNISLDVIIYRKYLPTAYSSISPFDDLRGGITYRKFFSLPLSREASITLNTPRNFAPSDLANVELQHPPLYYALLAPIYSMSRHWSWPTQMFLLRSVSWVFAFTGYVLGVAAIIRYWPKKDAGMVAAIAAAWPFLVPMFFPEMARLGSDSLCLLTMGGVWWMLLRIGSIGVEARPRDFVVLGVLLGIGLLTKAFFIPITVGVALFLFFRRDRMGLAVMLALSLLIGSPWYIYKFIATGVFSGGSDQLQIARQGGLIKGLAENFSGYGLARGLAAVVATTTWGGTLSLARFNEGFHAPLAILLLAPLFAYFARIYRTRPGDISWAPVLIISMFVAGLVHHVLLSLAQTGIGNNTPGWYLHILTGPMGFIYSLGLLWLLQFGAARVLFPALALYSVGYFAVVSWVQIAMYAGCAAKLGSVKYYAFPEGASCLLDVGRLTRNLSIIAEPYIGIPLLFGGIVSGGIGLAMLYVQMRRCFLDAALGK